MSFILRRAAVAITGAAKASVAEVIDAHLEMVSMILITTLWAVGYGWVEGTIGIGALLIQAHVPWFGRFSTYHFVLGLTIFAISFSFGFLKFTRMLYYRKRYMLFTAIGNYPYAMAVQDFSYFLFVSPVDRLEAMSWTCQGLGLGCFQIKIPWTYDVPLIIPWWYLVALSISACFFFLAYRSALVNLLVTRMVMKEVGFSEKTRVGERRQVPSGKPAPIAPIAPTPLVEVEKLPLIVDDEREELKRRLRERLLRQGM
jgi:hypothetical protein